MKSPNKRCRKVVINRCWGGFCLSPKATKMFWEKKGKRVRFYDYDFSTNKKTYKDPEEGDSFWHCEDADEKDEDRAYLSSHDIPRDDPVLVEVVSKLGDKANGSVAELKIVEIPADVDWEIVEYDGMEHVAEKHRTWD